MFPTFPRGKSLIFNFNFFMLDKCPVLYKTKNCQFLLSLIRFFQNTDQTLIWKTPLT